MSLSKTLYPLLSTGSTEEDHAQIQKVLSEGSNFDNVIFDFFLV